MCERVCVSVWARAVCVRRPSVGVVPRSPRGPGRGRPVGGECRRSRGKLCRFQKKTDGRGGRDVGKPHLPLLPLPNKTGAAALPAPASGLTPGTSVVGPGGDLARLTYSIIAVSASGAQAFCARADRGRTARNCVGALSATRSDSPGLIRRGTASTCIIAVTASGVRAFCARTDRGRAARNPRRGGERFALDPPGGLSARRWSASTSRRIVRTSSVNGPKTPRPSPPPTIGSRVAATR